MSSKSIWKPVTIGGLTGIVLGAGTMYALQPGAVEGDNGMPMPEQDAEQADAGQVPHEQGNTPTILAVSDEMSFNEAFAVGRAASGPGGLFTWRGNVYGTYTANEWGAMSDEEKDLFANHASSAIRAAAADSPQVYASTEERIPDDNDVKVVDDRVEGNGTSEETAQKIMPSWEDLASEDNDVRIVGYQDIEFEEGQAIGVQELDINGQRVAVIDVDNDGEADYAMTDLNHNRQMDEGEVIDLHTGEALTFTNDETDEDFTETTNTDDASDLELGAI